MYIDEIDRQIYKRERQIDKYLKIQRKIDKQISKDIEKDIQINIQKGYQGYSIKKIDRKRQIEKDRQRKIDKERQIEKD